MSIHRGLKCTPESDTDRPVPTLNRVSGSVMVETDRKIEVTQ